MKLQDFFRRTFNFFKKYSKHPLYVFIYGCNYFNQSFRSGLRFYSHADFADEIKKGKSVIRLGDGEVHIMNGGSIHYQRYEKGLDLAMRELVKNYQATSPYIVALPVFLNRSNSELRKENLFFVWMPAKVLYKILFPKKVFYSDAHFFYYDGFFKKYLEAYLMDKHLIIVSNERSVESFKNNPTIPFNKVSFVVTPQENSYRKYDNICEDIDSAISCVPKEEKIVLLISTGPTSKQMVYDFSKRGYQSLDIGRGLEVFYKEESIEVLFPELAHSKKENL